MRTLTRNLSMVLAVAFSMAGCATLNDVMRVKSEGGGTSQTYAVAPDQAWDIARTVFRWEGTDAIEEHRVEGYMLTSSGTNGLSYGTVMGAWIERRADQQTNVTVVTKRRVQTDLFTTLTEGTFHRRFAQAVEIMRSGKPLPTTPPDLGPREPAATTATR